MRILVAEDDEPMAEGLCRALRACGYAVDRVANGPEADAAMRVQRFDLVILELGLPGMSGFDVLRRLRRRESNTPVLILTAADSIASRVKGLDLGADDFMPKPFALSELEARVRALLRRGSHVEKSSTIRNGAIEYDKIGRVAYVNGKVLDMSGREIGLLEVMLMSRDRVVTKRQLVERLCAADREISINAIEVYMHRLRKKLEGEGVRIRTVPGIGYCLERPTETPDAVRHPQTALIPVYSDNKMEKSHQ